MVRRCPGYATCAQPKLTTYRRSQVTNFQQYLIIIRQYFQQVSGLRRSYQLKAVHRTFRRSFDHYHELYNPTVSSNRLEYREFLANADV